MMKFFNDILTLDFWIVKVASACAILTGFLALWQLGIMSDDKALTLVHFKNVAVLVVLMALSLFAYIAGSLRNSNNKNIIISSEINTVKRLVQQKCVKGQVTADQFFIKRTEQEEIPKVLESKPTTLKYSGGPLLAIVARDDFKEYLKSNNVSVQFIFPDPNIDYVIQDFVDNITVNETVKKYKADIEYSVKTLDELIRGKPNATIAYRFCKFAPSFGLQIIESDSNNRLYVDLYTIGIPKDDRYRFRIEEQNSPDTYRVFKDQFEKLWEKSSERKKNPQRTNSQTLTAKLKSALKRLFLFGT